METRQQRETSPIGRGMQQGSPGIAADLSRSHVALNPTAAAREVGGEVFIVTEDRGLHRLESATAVELFRALRAGTTRRDSLVERIVAEFDVSPEVAGADIDQFLETLVERRIAVRVTGGPDA